MRTIEEVLKEMTLEEKIELVSEVDVLTIKGNKSLGIPSLNMSDGPHGIRRILGVPSYPQECNIEGGDTCFPTASAVGASWNEELAFQIGAAIADDCKQEDIQILLAPGVNMKRTPHCGRNFEYYSEDPYLSAFMGAAFINGVQSKGIGTSLKHFAVNNQEINRGTINAEVDERTLREYYLRVFEILLNHCNPTSVMSAYNKLNGIWCSENPYLLTELLKEEWNYDGMVISDWGGVHSLSKALKAGLDMQMPRSNSSMEEVKLSLEKGILKVEDLDRAVLSVLKFVDNISKLSKIKTQTYSREEQHKKSYDAACECITLLRNEREILPITKEKYKKIAVLGRYAEECLYMGGGSSKVTVAPESIDIPLKYIKENAEGIEVDYFPIFKDGFHDTLIPDAVDTISNDYDCVLVFVGDNYGPDCETESFDRDNLKLPGYMNEMIVKTTRRYKNTVLIMQSGGAILPYRWEKIPAMVQMWYSGESAGHAIGDVLFGKINPSGKLSETFMKVDRTDLEYPGDGIKVSYKEGQEVGYRYYDKHPEEVWFPFGHGLSYTEYAYSDLSVNRTFFDSDKFDCMVSCKIKNVGKKAGKEVVQLYIAPLDSVVARPIKELRGFHKVELEPYEEKTISFHLSENDFAYYNTCIHNWHVESGNYAILVAASSQDIKLQQQLCIEYNSDFTKDKYDGSKVI